MKNHRQLLLLGFLCIGVFQSIVHGEDGEIVERAEPVRKTINIEGTPLDLTEAAKKTLNILKAEKFETITIDLFEPQRTFEILKARLARQGVAVRLKHYLSPQNYERSEPLGLRNIPLAKLMEIFDGCVHWGWIIYPDGSITYFDNQCGCCWPQNFGCHKSQYDAGKPEVMERDRKAAAEIPRAEQDAPSNR